MVLDPFRVMTEPDPLLYGSDRTERIVAVEPAGGSSVRRYIRSSDGGTRAETVRCNWWIVTTRDGADALDTGSDVQRLDGDLMLSHLVNVTSWRDFLAAEGRLRDLRTPMYSARSPVEQYLTASGSTLFKGMEYGDLRRLQIDIETTSLDPSHQDAEILVIALRCGAQFEDVLHRGGSTEEQMLERLTSLIRELDPDVIEGHNLFNFDLPYIQRRAQRLGVRLGWGRDGSTPTSRPQRFRTGALRIPFNNVYVYGRHLIDTYQQVWRLDAGGNLQSYGLKEAVEALGLERSDRVFVPGDQVASIWKRDPDEILRYALDDVRDVDMLSSLAVPTEFHQTQMTPRPFQSVATGGPGEKINAIMVRAYLAENHSLSMPETSRPYPGGLTELREVGVFQPVVKCDVESLYPAIMLTDRIAPARDRLDVFLKLLAVLTERRLAAKRLARDSSGSERTRWDGLQSSFKVLINSFYGYLGYNRALFNDYSAAERVTLRGQALIRTVVEELERRGATPIEIDTDGVYFRPPDDLRGVNEEESFIEEIGSVLPEGINLAHDGSYAGMISLKTKNYALLQHDGRLVMKGSSLRSRRDERVLRRFMGKVATAMIEQSRQAARDAYFTFAREIIERRLPPEDIVRTESVTEKTYTSTSTRRLAEAVRGASVGERVQVYEREDGQLVPITEYAGDENRDYLLQRLRDSANRFRPLFETDSEFGYHFPPITSATDLTMLKQSLPASQLSMFPE
jgi:DNA polymerase, archaea type